jgi:hypothetical protein
MKLGVGIAIVRFKLPGAGSANVVNVAVIGAVQLTVDHFARTFRRVFLQLVCFVGHIDLLLQIEPNGQGKRMFLPLA